MAAVSFPMEAKIGAFFGTVMGGLLGGWKCHHLDPAISKQQGAIYGVANTVNSFVLRELGKWWFGDKFNDIPWKWQMVICGSFSTLLTGTAANMLKIPLMFSSALRITLIAAGMGVLGVAIGFSRASVRQPGE
jgi:hypothetical protein